MSIGAAWNTRRSGIRSVAQQRRWRADCVIVEESGVGRALVTDGHGTTMAIASSEGTGHAVAVAGDRLSRSLVDFARMVEMFDAKGVSFVSITQQFNTTTSMGRLTLNVLLSFAQFEREVTGERIRDKIAASKKKGMWMGGVVPLGYDLKARNLTVNQEEATTVRLLFRRYLELGTVRQLKAAADELGLVTKPPASKRRPTRSASWSRCWITTMALLSPSFKRE
jgi:DNA invertase Pin-like site-specific DNA recombinase